jgi:hypothetical protein
VNHIAGLLGIVAPKKRAGIENFGDIEYEVIVNQFAIIGWGNEIFRTLLISSHAQYYKEDIFE